MAIRALAASSNFFFSGYSGFPIHPLRCLELDFCSSLSKVGLNLGHIVYLRIFLYNLYFGFHQLLSLSSSHSPFLLLLLTPSTYCVILLTSQSFLEHVSQSRPFSFRQPPSIKLTQAKWSNCSFFCFYVVRSFKKRTFSKISMFCPVLSN